MNIHKHLPIKSRANLLKKFDDANAMLWRGTAIDEDGQFIPSPANWGHESQNHTKVRQWFFKAMRQGKTNYLLTELDVEVLRTTNGTLLHIAVEEEKFGRIVSQRFLSGSQRTLEPAHHLTATTTAGA